MVKYLSAVNNTTLIAPVWFLNIVYMTHFKVLKGNLLLKVSVLNTYFISF